MARDFGRVACRIWDDGDFCALEPDAQRMYLFLLSQPELNHAGLLPMRLKRWAATGRGLTPDRVMVLLKELDRTRFALFDEDTEEVWVRTLVRNDGIWRQPKVMLRMEKDADQIKSVRIRAAFAAELQLLPLAELDGTYQFQTARDVVWRLLSKLLGADADDGAEGYPEPGGDLRNPYPEGFPKGYREGFTEGYAEPPARAHAQPPPPPPNQTLSSDAAASTSATGESGTLFGHDPAADQGTAKTTKRGAKAKPDLDPEFVEWWVIYPRKDGKAEAVKAWPKARKKASFEEIKAGTIRYRDDPERTTKYTKMPGPWLNAERWNDGLEQPTEPQPSGWTSYFDEIGD